MSAGKKTIEGKQTIFYWKVCNVLGKIFYCIRNNCSKIRTYTVLNTLSGNCNFGTSGLKYCKTLSKKLMYKIKTYK